MAKIDHAAIRTASYEDAQKFFEDVWQILYLIFDYPYKHYTFKYFEV